jgi:hypothetical protein
MGLLAEGTMVMWPTGSIAGSSVAASAMDASITAKRFLRAGLTKPPFS